MFPECGGDCRQRANTRISYQQNQVRMCKTAAHDGMSNHHARQHTRYRRLFYSLSGTRDGSTTHGGAREQHKNQRPQEYVFQFQGTEDCPQAQRNPAVGRADSTTLLTTPIHADQVPSANIRWKWKWKWILMEVTGHDETGSALKK